MLSRSLLVANRGEIAIRIFRAAAELGIHTVAIHSKDDANSLHTRRADEARALDGSGPGAYLDGAQIIAIAKQAGCDAIHPGYGFLAENGGFARDCASSGLTFVGPRGDLLDALGDKTNARAIAKRAGVAVLRGTSGATSVAQAREFLASIGGRAIMVKALAGGGGRGIRAVTDASQLEEAFARCSSEAKAAFGDGALYVEELMPRARHVEVQILADLAGNVSHLYERECTIQRRNQKVVEIAPSPFLTPELRERITDAAVRIAREAHYENIGTFEFLIDAAPEGAPYFAFIEANPRIQVEHTVTEEVSGRDIVQIQLELAGGRTLADLHLTQSEIAPPRGYAIQARINMETMTPDGGAKPAGGTISAFDGPSGSGLRIDSYAYAGYTTNPRFDSLLAKLITYSPSPDFAAAARRMYRALAEFRIEGVATNIGFLMNLVSHPDFVANRLYTRFVEDHAAELTAHAPATHRRLFFESIAPVRRAGAKVDTKDPLAVLDYGKGGNASVTESAVEAPAASRNASVVAPDGMIAIIAPMQGTIVSLEVSEGDTVRKGQQVAVMEAMKMEHVIRAEQSGIVRELVASKGDAVYEGDPLMFIEAAEVEVAEAEVKVALDLDRIRPDLAEVFARHAQTLDSLRPEAVARRRKTHQRTARENVEDLCDRNSFVEFAPLVIAAQRRRRTIEDLTKNTPADGMLAGVGTINAEHFPPDRSRCAILAYDYTVLAGTQGQQNHRKKDRLFEIAEKNRLPVVFFTEGGGGRPGDTDGVGVAGLDCMAFNYWGRLSGLVPMVAVNSGRCFAGNAAILGCCDVVIATRNSNIGMGGPAMIEGGGLGIFRPEEVGPIDVQTRNGVVDIAVEDEAEGVAIARKYLSYFQGTLAHWNCADQRILRTLIPENRLRVYDVRKVIETMADADTMLEIRRDFGLGMITAFIRVEGHPIGVIANNPVHLAGAIDSPGADKGARFMQLCDAYDIPILFLCDTPGIMVGPEVEKTALVRHASRMFVIGSNITVPFFTIILRKGYGLGAQAMAGGSFKAPFFTIAWPTGEFGGMGLEGAVKLGYRKELEAETDPDKRKLLFDEMVERMYRNGKAVNTASHFEIDDVIDPMESRRWITAALRSAPPAVQRTGKKRPNIDTW